MGSFNCYAVDHDKAVEIKTDSNNPTINISLTYTNENSNAQTKLMKNSSRDNMRPKGARKKKKDIKYSLEVKYTERQVVNDDDCFYIKNLISTNNKGKITNFRPRQIRFETLIDKVTEARFTQQLQETHDIDRVFADFQKIANIILKPVGHNKVKDEPIEY